MTLTISMTRMMCNALPRRARFVAVLTAVFVTGGLPGCGSSGTGPKRAVQGRVSLAGAPVESGAIEFHLTGNGPKGLAGGAMIVGGRYSIPGSHGLLPGTYRVVIRAPGDPVPLPALDDTNSPGGGGPVPMPKGLQRYTAAERIPPAYNEQSTVEVQVLTDGPNQFDFAIP